MKVSRYVRLSRADAQESESNQSLSKTSFPYSIAQEVVRFCDLVYSDDSNVIRCLHSAGYGSLAWFEQDAMQGAGFVHNDCAFLAFRGSSEWKDWYYNLRCLPRGSPAQHTGFMRAWNLLRPQVLDWVGSLPSASRKFIVTGHSLGGALAILAAYTLTNPDDPQCKHNQVSHVITFGGPRVGLPSFMDSYNGRPASVAQPTPSLKDVTWRIVHQLDVIQRFPPGIFGYRHVGKQVYIGRDSHFYEQQEAEVRQFDDVLDFIMTDLLSSVSGGIADSYGNLVSRIFLGSKGTSVSGGIADSYRNSPEYRGQAFGLWLAMALSASWFIPYSFLWGTMLFLKDSRRDHFRQLYLTAFRQQPYCPQLFDDKVFHLQMLRDRWQMLEEEQRTILDPGSSRSIRKDQSDESKANPHIIG
jgi:pimeloyl-ACP methyl ester carboxylesterase